MPTVVFGRHIGPQPGFSGTVDVYGPGTAGALPPGVPAQGVSLLNPASPTNGTVQMHNQALAAFSYTNNIMYIASKTGPDIRDLVRPHDIPLPPGLGAAANTNPAPDMKPFTVFEDDRVKVTTVLVPHGGVFPSFAFRFDSRHGSVTISGDTQPSANVARLATDTCLLVHEVMFGDQMLDAGVPADFVAYLRTGHTDITQLGAVAQQAGARQLAMSHIVAIDPRTPYGPPVREYMWRPPLRSYRGKVQLGEDLMRLRVG